LISSTNWVLVVREVNSNGTRKYRIVKYKLEVTIGNKQAGMIY